MSVGQFWGTRIMGMLFGGSKRPDRNPMQEQAQALEDARNQALQNQQNQQGYQQVSRLQRRKTSSGSTPVVSSGGFFGSGGRGSSGSDRRGTFLGG